MQKREGYLESKVLHNKRNDVIPKKSSQDAPQNKKLPPLFSTKSNDKAEIQVSSCSCVYLNLWKYLGLE